MPEVDVRFWPRLSAGERASVEPEAHIVARRDVGVTGGSPGTEFATSARGISARIKVVGRSRTDHFLRYT